ncbi:hypothetical protein KJ657_02755 [Patescibacteria group bacterium]|nr:hypothetical protein [Patescibacteria group bacterium]MBU1015988.1 hypothetical protein [Patescibacteria group bacterium]MBU1684803.1 hypothetical protein [Patescibacteria group bacterium]MBU1938773.1 hypothetical protein [Patescibacteria group bacterium]
MSINKPCGVEGMASSRFRKAIRLVLVSSFLMCQPTDAITTEPTQKKEDYFEGIEIVPDDTPIKRPPEKDKKKHDDSNGPSAPFCTSDSCKYA